MRALCVEGTSLRFPLKGSFKGLSQGSFKGLPLGFREGSFKGSFMRLLRYSLALFLFLVLKPGGMWIYVCTCWSCMAVGFSVPEIQKIMYLPRWATGTKLLGVSGWGPVQVSHLFVVVRGAKQRQSHPQKLRPRRRTQRPPGSCLDFHQSCFAVIVTVSIDFFCDNVDSKFNESSTIVVTEIIEIPKVRTCCREYE